MSTEIELTVDDSPMPAYVATPAGEARGGVIVIQEIFGVTQPMKNVADLLAGEGYLAIVPAVFHRVDPHYLEEYNDEGIKRGKETTAKTELDGVEHDLAASAAYLRERLGAGKKVGVWGFCYGGSLAYFAATFPFIDAAVSFYGGSIAVAQGPNRPAFVGFTDAIHVPMLLGFGGLDASISTDEIERIHTALQDANKNFILNVYEGGGHGFFRPGPDSSPDAAEAWRDVKAFLTNTLG